MVAERNAGRTRVLGVSNVGVWHLQVQAEHHSELPAFVQNRCFARFGWDREVRAFCREHKIRYQGFSLLTANPEVLSSKLVREIASRNNATPAQVVFRFSIAVGMLPLTGTSDPTHMAEDLGSHLVELSEKEVAAIESIAG